jgi:hypothetical protein
MNVSKKKLKKPRMTNKQAGRALQRMQTYVNDMTLALNKHKPQKDEALASVFVIAVRLAKLQGSGSGQFLDEAESAWENLSKLPIDGDKIVAVDADVIPSWRGWLAAGVTVSGWAVAAALFLTWTLRG